MKTPREISVWDTAFATAWANTEIVGLMKASSQEGDTTVHRRRQRCEALADAAVNAHRVSTRGEERPRASRAG